MFVTDDGGKVEDVLEFTVVSTVHHLQQQEHHHHATASSSYKYGQRS